MGGVARRVHMLEMLVAIERVAVEDRVVRLRAQAGRKTPREVHRIADARIHAVATGRGAEVRGVARKQDPAHAVVGHRALVHREHRRPRNRAVCNSQHLCGARVRRRRPRRRQGPRVHPRNPKRHPSRLPPRWHRRRPLQKKPHRQRPLQPRRKHPLPIRRNLLPRQQNRSHLKTPSQRPKRQRRPNPWNRLP